MRKTILAAAAAAVLIPALAGCQAARQTTAYAEGKVDEAIAIKRKQSDVEARAAINVPCVTTVGAFMRELNEREQVGLALICAPPEVTEADIKRFLGRTRGE